MPPVRNQKLGQAIKDARRAKGMSLRQLSDASGVEYTTIFRFEAGEFAAPDPLKLQKLARALDVDVEDFYALAGYFMPEGLPELAPYMRAKYGMPDEAAEDLQRYFARLQKRYGVGTPPTPPKPRGGRHGDAAR